MTRSLFALILLTAATAASADCWYNGVMYPTGTIINGLTCQADGSWK